jgi:signal recognition particle GTPase
VATQDQRLAREIHALFNGAHLSDAQREKMLSEVKKILTDAEVSADDVTNVIADLTAIVAETK